MKLRNKGLIVIIGGILLTLLLSISFLKPKFNPDVGKNVGKTSEKAMVQKYQGPVRRSTKFKQNLYKNH